MTEKYEIIEVLNNETQERDEKYAYRIGRKCTIVNCTKGSIFIGEYENKSLLMTSTVINIEQKDDDLKVETKNRTYTFRKVNS